jgi:iron complex transport system permease protein
MRERVTARGVAVLVLSLSALLAAVLLLALSLGSVSISFFRLLALLVGDGSIADAGTDARIIFDVRLPRVLLAACVGGGLALAGVVFQVLLRNVLADPYILGVSGGASVGALVAASTGFALLFPGATSLAAFAGAALVAVAVYGASGRAVTSDGSTLLLSGVMAGAFLGAVILALVSLGGDPVRSALFWLLGFLGNATMEQVLISTVVLGASAVVLVLRANTMNVLALGGESAAALGVPVRGMFLMLYGVASLLTAVLVSVAGSIGFIGLIVPHICRLLFGADHRVLVPTSLLTGAIFLVIADLGARMLLSPVELPVGAVTAALGAPLFIFLLRRRG